MQIKYIDKVLMIKILVSKIWGILSSVQKKKKIKSYKLDNPFLKRI